MVKVKLTPLQIKQKARGAMGGSSQASSMDNTTTGQGNMGQGFDQSQGNLGRGFDDNNMGAGKRLQINMSQTHWGATRKREHNVCMRCARLFAGGGGGTGVGAGTGGSGYGTGSGGSIGQSVRCLSPRVNLREAVLQPVATVTVCCT